MKPKIVVGLDGGCVEHAVVAMTEAKERLLKEKFVNDHAGCDLFVKVLNEFSKEGYEVWIAAEGSGGILSPFDRRVAEAGHKFVGFHPRQVKAFRKMVRVQDDKDDHLDAELLVEMLLWLGQNGELEVTEQREEYFLALRETARAYESAMKHKVKMGSRLFSKVREYWPELMVTDPIFENNDAKGLLAVLAKYPSPEKICRAGAARIAQILRKARSHRCSQVAEKFVEQARSIRGKVVVSEATEQLVKRLTTGLLSAMEEQREWEKTLEELLESHPFGVWLLEQEGVGVKTAGCFLGEAGNLDRYPTEAKLARYAGNGAVEVQSGSSAPRHYDGHQYNHHLKRTIILMAGSRSKYHAESREYLAMRRARGDTYWEALKKLARHHIRFLWKSWEQVMKNQEVAPVSKADFATISP
jgi:transposase